jgi:minor extracellular protease Epr
MYRTVCAALFHWLAAVGVVLIASATFDGSSLVTAAFAQDDDGGDDDGGDDDGGAGAGRGDDDDDDAPRRSPSTQRRVPAAPPAAVVPLLDRAPDEIVVVDLSADDLDLLIARGYAVIQTQTTTVLATVSHRLRIPDGTALEAARDEVRALPTGQTADFNHYYRTDQDDAPVCSGPHCPGFELVGFDPVSLTPGCGAGARIGLIDTGINPDHETFADGQLTVISVAPEDQAESDAQHGTAVAAILIGRADSRSPGLLPAASVTAIDAFHKVDGDQRSDVFSLVDAMDRLAVAEVDVVNMSLSGPDNIVLERMVKQLTNQGIVVVAVAGNDGPRADPVFPGAYAPVLTVTAVDRDGNVYRRAGQGPHVDIAAPGVEVWTAASVRGARGKTGTSFAAPFVTAAVAIVMARNGGSNGGANGRATVQEVTQAVTGSARDLGDPGRDEVFGAGLVQLGQVCSGTTIKANSVE